MINEISQLDNCTSHIYGMAFSSNYWYKFRHNIFPFVTLMKTLYDVLGLSRTASAAQIEQAYRFHLDNLDKDSASPEDGVIRGKALREAYTVLSSELRKKEYDLKLSAKEQITYQVVEKASGPPWILISVVVAIICGGFGYYKYEAHRAEVERIALEAEKAKAAAELEAKKAAEEQAQLDQQKLNIQRQQDYDQKRQTEIARIEGQQAQDRVARSEAQAARDKMMADQQAANARMMEEQAARIRTQNETAAMQRALAIPIPRH